MRCRDLNWRVDGNSRSRSTRTVLYSTENRSATLKSILTAERVKCAHAVTRERSATSACARSALQAPRHRQGHAAPGSEACHSLAGWQNPLAELVANAQSLPAPYTWPAPRHCSPRPRRRAPTPQATQTRWAIIRRGCIMDPAQRYQLDCLGYLHIRGALSPSELAAARAAADSYCAAADRARQPGGLPLPAGFADRAQAHHGKYSNGVLWSPALEALLFHPSTWPAILELTGGRPKFTGGTMLVDDADRGLRHAAGAHLHGVRDRQLNKEQARDPQCVCQLREDGRTLRCNNFVVFP